MRAKLVVRVVLAGAVFLAGLIFVVGSMFAAGAQAAVRAGARVGANARVETSDRVEALVRSGAMVRVGANVRLPQSASVVGATSAGKQLSLSLALMPQQSAELATLATEVSTPGSAEYRQYLSVQQFSARFGASASTIAAVENVLRADGLSVGALSANHLTLAFEGTVAQLDQAFGVGISNVRLANGTTAYSNLSAPAFPSSIAADVRGVIGLSDVNHEQASVDLSDQVLRARLRRDRNVLDGPIAGASSSSELSLRRLSSSESNSRDADSTTGGPTPSSSCDFGASTGSEVYNSGLSQDGYSYDQIAADYGFSSLYGQGDLGAGQTVAIVEFGPTFTSDIAAFQKCYGTDTTVNLNNVDGGPNENSGDDSEESLDIEAVIGLAPQATIDVYQAPDDDSNYNLLSRILSDGKAKVISESWGECESDVEQDSDSQVEIGGANSLLQEAAVQGVSFFASSGDAGSEACSQGDNGAISTDDEPAVNDPASQPYATSVGGTSMFTNDDGSFAWDDSGSAPSELVWNSGLPWSEGGGGSGGGRSDLWPMPSYQSSANSALGVIDSDSSGSGYCGSTYCREVPDVSADGNENTGYIVYGTSGDVASWNVIGGTSAAAPLWAAVAALTNALPSCDGKSIGFANPALYKLAGSNYSADFNDIQSTVDGVAFSSEFPDASNNDTLGPWGVTDSANPSDLYPVTNGYDMATGLGSPKVGSLASGLCAAAQSSSGSGGSGSGGSGSGSGGSGSGSGGSGSGSSGSGSGSGGSGSGVSGSTNARVTGGSFAGTARRVPVLRVSATAASASAAITKLTLKVPSGFSLSHNVATLKRSLVVKDGARKLAFTVSVSGSTLTVNLKSATTGVTITLSHPGLIESAAEGRSVSKGKIKRVSVALRLFELGSHQNAVTLSLAV